MPAREFKKTTVVRETVEPDVVQVETPTRRLIERDTLPARSSAAAIIYYVLDVIEVLLALRLIFRLLGANPGNGLVNLIYAITAPLVAPFVGIFRTPSVGGSVLEWSTIIAMIVYALIAYLIVQLIRVSTRPYAQ